MTRKDYVQLAELMRYRLDNARKDGNDDKITVLSLVAYDMCRVFAKENPNFDAVRFLNAVGL